MGLQVELLFFESGDWLIGVDPESVRWIDHAAEGADGYPLEKLLGLPEVVLPGKPRGLTVIAADTEHIVWVDRLIGIEVIDGEYIHPLPQVLRNFEAPGWLLGIGRRDDRLALLVDLLKAIRAEEGD